MKQSLKESIYTDPHALNSFGVLENKKNILKISKDTQALILFFKIVLISRQKYNSNYLN